MQRFAGGLSGGRGGGNGKGLGVVGRPAALNQIEQMAVLHCFDLVRKKDEPTIEFIQFAAIEFVAQLLVTLR